MCNANMFLVEKNSAACGIQSQTADFESHKQQKSSLTLNPTSSRIPKRYQAHYYCKKILKASDISYLFLFLLSCFSETWLLLHKYMRLAIPISSN